MEEEFYWQMFFTTTIQGLLYLSTKTDLNAGKSEDIWSYDAGNGGQAAAARVVTSFAS